MIGVNDKPGRTIDDLSFVITTQVREMAAICYSLIETKDMGVIYGDPGVGKTFTAKRMVDKWQKRGYPKIVYTEVDVGSTPSGIAKKILKVLADLRPANAADTARIIENLTQEHELELIILDEAERLNRHSLEMVRSIYDRTGVPILLIGMTDILRKLRSHKKFYSRIGIAYRFKQLTFNQLTEYIDELYPLFKNTNKQKLPDLLKFLYESTRGEFRRINRLIKQAERIRIANGHSKLSLPLFQAASKLMLNATSN